MIRDPFRYFDSLPEVIRLVAMMYVKHPLSLRNVEDLLAERGIDISVAGSTIGLRIHISHFDYENGRCGGFEARQRCGSSAQFTPPSIITSIMSGIWSVAKSTRDGAPPLWSNGAPS